jgi:GT2 family glycosyltransferase
LPAAGSLYKRTFFEKVGSLSDSYTLIEDYTTSLRALRIGIPVYYVDAITIKHREGGISHGNQARRNGKYAQ